MASSAIDDGFHEIQLNGKQLVFLFMAATVVSVVIFLCGVFVGRGVRAERTVAQAAALNDAPSPDILPSASASAPATIQAGADPRMAAPPRPVDEKSTGVTEDIRPDSAKAADAARAAAAEKKAAATIAAKLERTDKPASTDNAEKVAKAERAQERPTPSSSPAPATATPSDGYAVQVAAVNVRTDADAIAKRLNSKGYTAYVEVPPNGTGTVFRVRIGTFKTKREAETIAARLQKEEQIKPWVTR